MIDSAWLTRGFSRVMILSVTQLPAVYEMPKQKTHKGTKKRFRLTAKGKAKHRQSGTSHLASRMDQKRKRNLRGTTTVATVMEKSIREALAGNSY
jgi:large subunit ribosomal protein L35